MRRRDLLKTAAAATLTAGVAPRLGRGADRAKTLVFVPTSDLTVLDPVVTGARPTRNSAYLVFDTLYGIDTEWKAPGRWPEPTRAFRRGWPNTARNMAFDARSVCTDQLANGETPRGQPLKLLEPGTWPPSLEAPQKQRPTFGRFTIDLIVVSSSPHTRGPPESEGAWRSIGTARREHRRVRIPRASDRSKASQVDLELGRRAGPERLAPWLQFNGRFIRLRLIRGR